MLSNLDCTWTDSFFRFAISCSNFTLRFIALLCWFKALSACFVIASCLLISPLIVFISRLIAPSSSLISIIRKAIGCISASSSLIRASYNAWYLVPDENSLSFCSVIPRCSNKPSCTSFNESNSAFNFCLRKILCSSSAILSSRNSNKIWFSASNSCCKIWFFLLFLAICSRFDWIFWSIACNSLVNSWASASNLVTSCRLILTCCNIILDNSALDPVANDWPTDGCITLPNCFRNILKYWALILDNGWLSACVLNLSICVLSRVLYWLYKPFTSAWDSAILFAYSRLLFSASRCVLSNNDICWYNVYCSSSWTIWAACFSTSLLEFANDSIRDLRSSFFKTSCCSKSLSSWDNKFFSLSNNATISASLALRLDGDFCKILTTSLPFILYSWPYLPTKDCNKRLEPTCEPYSL